MRLRPTISKTIKARITPPIKIIEKADPNIGEESI